MHAVRRASHGALLAAAALVVLALAATPALATFTPANVSVTASSTDLNVTDDGSGLRVRCPRTDFTGRTSADGRSFSGTLAFADPVARTTCGMTSSGSITWRSTSSVAGSSASGTLSFNSGFSWNYSLLGAPRTIRGPQAPSNCTWTYAQGVSRAFLTCRTIAVDGGGTLTWMGSFPLSPRLTIS